MRFFSEENGLTFDDAKTLYRLSKGLHPIRIVWDGREFPARDLAQALQGDRKIA
jgi:hypothetical protein